jgi:hypothetical protein
MNKDNFGGNKSSSMRNEKKTEISREKNVINLNPLKPNVNALYHLL